MKHDIMKRIIIPTIWLLVISSLAVWALPKPIAFMNQYSVFYRGDTGEPVAVTSGTPLFVTMSGSTTVNLTIGSPTFSVDNFPATQSVDVVSSGAFSFQGLPTTSVASLATDAITLLDQICSFTPPCELQISGDLEFYVYGGATSTLSSVQSPALLVEKTKKLSFKPSAAFALSFAGLATPSQIAVIQMPLIK